MPRHLELTIEGKPGEISLESFAVVIRNAFDILTNLDKAVSAEPLGTLEWFIAELSYGSLVVAIEARPKDRYVDPSARVVESFVSGIEHIRLLRTIPPYFSDYDLKKTQAIANALRKGGANAVVVRDIERRSEATIEPGLSAELSRLFIVKYKEIGSVEGKLEMVSVHGAPRFTVYHAVTRHSIRCRFDSATYLEKVKEALGRRVIVDGRIHLNFKHEPIRVDIEGLDVLQDERVLPAASELRGMAPDFTGELTTEAYLRRLRSG